MIVVLLLLLTFILRAYRLDHIAFDSDFGRDSLFGWRILTEKPTLLGAQASVGGFYLGPLYFYGLAVIYGFFGPIPELVSLSFALLNVVAAGMGYIFLRKRINTQAGFLFLLIFATQALLISASRSATHAPMLPAITMFSLIMLFRALERQQLKHFLLAGLALGIFLHVHFSALLLFPGVFLLLGITSLGSWKRRLLKLASYGFGVVLMISPLIFFDLRHGFLTSRAFVTYIVTTIQGGGLRDSFPHWTMGETIQNLALYLGPSRSLQVLIAIGVLYGLVRVILRPKLKVNTNILFLTLLSVSVIALLLVYPGYLFSYYLIVPGTLILLTVSAVLSKLPKVWIGLALGLGVALGSLQAVRSLYTPQFRTRSHLESIISPIQSHLTRNNRPPFAIFKDSSDGLTGLGYEYRFLLERDGYQPVSEYDYHSARVLYVIREEGTSDPLRLGGHEMTQFQPKSAQHIERLSVFDRTIDLFALYKEDQIPVE